MRKAKAKDLREITQKDWQQIFCESPEASLLITPKKEVIERDIKDIYKEFQAGRSATFRMQRAAHQTSTELLLAHTGDRINHPRTLFDIVPEEEKPTTFDGAILESETPQEQPRYKMLFNMFLMKSLSNASYNIQNKDFTGLLKNDTDINNLPAQYMGILPAPQIYISLAELTKAVELKKDSQKPNSKERKRAYDYLMALHSSYFTITFPNGLKFRQQLLNVANIIETKSGRVFFDIRLHPMYSSQSQGYISIPQNIFELLAENNSKTNNGQITEIDITLMTLLLGQQYETYKISLFELLIKLGLHSVDKSKSKYARNPKRIKKLLQESFIRLVKMGILQPSTADNLNPRTYLNEAKETILEFRINKAFNHTDKIGLKTTKKKK